MGAILYHHVVEKWFLRILAKIIQTSQKMCLRKKPYCGQSKPQRLQHSFVPWHNSRRWHHQAQTAWRRLQKRWLPTTRPHEPRLMGLWSFLRQSTCMSTFMHIMHFLLIMGIAREFAWDQASTAVADRVANCDVVIPWEAISNILYTSIYPPCWLGKSWRLGSEFTQPCTRATQEMFQCSITSTTHWNVFFVLWKSY
jgi:hypothetical protein